MFNKLFRIIKKIINFDLIDDELINSLVLYISSGEALPETLTNSDEDILMQMLDSDKREYAVNELITHNLRLVVYISKKFENTGVDLDDLISIGSVGLIKAVKSFKYDKNIKLATYASRCIENEILMHLRKIVKQKKEVSIDEPLNVDYDGNELLLADLLPNEDTDLTKELEQNEQQKILLELIKKLNESEQKIVKMRFGIELEREFTQKEVADELGISQSYISRLEKKIFERLKKELSKIS